MKLLLLGTVGLICNAQISGIIRPYEAPAIPPVRLNNSDRVGTLMRAGKIYLSLHDAIELAMENNLDLEIARYGPLLANSAQNRANFFQALAVEKSQHDGMAVGFTQAGQGGVQHWRDLLPDSGLIVVQAGLHIRLLFASNTSDFTSDKSRRRQPCGLVEPAFQNDAFAQVPGFSCENDKDGLRDFLGLMRVAGVP